MNSTIITYSAIPIISALIGWVTNYLAVKMIFRPRKEIRILGIPIIGLIPKRRTDLARKIGETVEKELISHKDIQNIVGSAEFRTEALQTIRTKIDEFFTSTLAANPLLALVVSSDMQNRVKDRLIEELERGMPNLIEGLMQKIETRMDFKEIVREKVEGFELNRLEEIVYAIAARELKAIELFGGVLGFVVGLVQVGILTIGGVHG